MSNGSLEVPYERINVNKIPPFPARAFFSAGLLHIHIYVHT